jgi:hypothetical protein
VCIHSLKDGYLTLQGKRCLHTTRIPVYTGISHITGM